MEAMTLSYWLLLTMGPMRDSGVWGSAMQMDSLRSFRRALKDGSKLLCTRTLEVALQIWPDVQKTPNCIQPH